MHEAWKDTRINPSAKDYVDMLKSQMRKFHKVFVVIDALDECLNDVETNTLSKFLDACQQLPEKAHTLFTSRRGSINFAQTKEPTPGIPITAKPDDIRAYLKESINSRARLRGMIEAELKRNSLFLKETLDTIVIKSQEM